MYDILMSYKFYLFIFIVIVTSYWSLATRSEQEFKTHNNIKGEIKCDIIKICLRTMVLNLFYQSESFINFHNPINSLLGRLIIIASITLFYHAVLRPYLVDV